VRNLTCLLGLTSERRGQQAQGHHVDE
jgi:hypothetical protein